jgi:3-oxoacyl-[acyl-carrier protein] reductase
MPDQEAVMTTNLPGVTGATALVTGASRGIGAVIARHLAQAGATVAITGRDVAALESVRAGLGPGARAVPAELRDSASVAALAAAIGPVDLVVATAGGLGKPVSVVEMTDEQWHATVDTNLTSAFHTLRAFLPGMIARRRGAIVTMSSTAGRQASPASPAYGASNAGLLMLTRQAALQVAEHGVRVNAIAPGSIETERLTTLMPAQAREQLAAAHPLRRLGTPDDVAQATLFLLSDNASWITGATLDINGGRLMQ